MPLAKRVFETAMIKMEKRHRKQALSLLTSVFKDEFTEVFPDPEERRIKEPHAHEFFFKYSLPISCSFVTSENVEGVAMWMRSDEWKKRPLLRIITSGAIWPAFKIGRKALRKMQQFDEYMNKKHRELAPGKHWYLGVLAVDPEHQGKGYGGELLREMLSRIDKEGLPCYLETEGEKNVSMYKHFGFEVLEEFTIPGTKDLLVAMSRAPAQSH